MLGLSATLLANPVKVLMQTSLGDITLELYPDKAPKTVANFLQYADGGFYNNTVFHRVISGFMIQGGGFNKEYSKKDTRRPVRNEASNGLKNRRGTIAMARTSDPHSATAQFFINHTDNDALNHSSKDFSGWGYTVFGKVTKGMGTVDAIADQHTTTRGGGMQNVPIKPIIIKSIQRL
jgi:cyclophilin family peptidyl-prolyl cis-trans isomerase